SDVPGCRTPHLWCRHGGSLYDAMGPEFTLLRFDRAADVTLLEAAARERRVPLKVLDIEPPRTATFYGGGLVLSRPDQQVAWRGGRLPTDPLALIDHVPGAAS
ncbi:MAG: monooxygenase, partial [Bradyrhizobium sp.]